MRRLAVAAAVAMVAASGLAGTACGPAGQSCFGAGGEGVLTYAHLWHAPVRDQPHDNVYGTLKLLGGSCPPQSGSLTLQLQRKIAPGLWLTIATDGPEHVPVVSGHQVLMGVFKPCTPGRHAWRLHYYGKGIDYDGAPTAANVYYPSRSGRVFRCP